MDATWHSRPRGSATRAHAGPRGAYAAYTYTYYLFIYYIYKGSSAFPIWEGLLIVLIVRCYKPDDLCYFSLCGTNPHDELNAGNVADGETSDRDDASISRVDRMECRPPKDHQARAQKEGIITALM